MAERNSVLIVDVSQPVKNIKSLIRVLRVANRELRTYESLGGTTVTEGSR